MAGEEGHETDQRPRARLSRVRVAAVYVFCLIGAAIIPVERYLNDGHLDTGVLLMSALGFLVGAATVTWVVISLRRTGRFLQFRL